MKNNKYDYIVLTNGDANSAKTWSNVPYFFTKNLEKQNKRICKMSIHFDDCSNKIEKFIALLIKVFLRLVRKITNNKSYTLNRTKYYEYIITRRIKKIIDNNPNTDIISISFSHAGTKYKKNQKIIMFSDWSYKYLIEKQEKRKPGYFENFAIIRQEEELKKADFVISLYPDAQMYMEKELDKRVYYIGNVINSEIKTFNSDEVISKKYYSKNFLFIGRKQYVSSLITYEKLLNSNMISETIDVVGLNAIDLKNIKNKKINFYGYLNKNNSEDSKKYYDCIFRAKAIINITENWNGMSSLIETMYYNTPIIVVPNKNTIHMFGKKCKCGYYCTNNSQNELLKAINYINKCSLYEYSNLCKNAHDTVKDYTWEKYISNFLKLIECEQKEGLK